MKLFLLSLSLLLMLHCSSKDKVTNSDNKPNSSFLSYYVYPASSGTNRLIVKGYFLFTKNSNGVQVLNVSNKATPIITSSISIDSVSSIALNDTTLFVARPNKVYLISVANHSNLYKYDSLIYVGTPTPYVSASDSLLFVNVNSSLIVYSLHTTSMRPDSIGYYAAATTTSDMTVYQQKRVLVMPTSNGVSSGNDFTLYDFTNPRAISYLSKIDIGTYTIANSLSIYDSVNGLAVANSDGNAVLINLSNPSFPLVGTSYAPGGNGGRGAGVVKDCVVWAATFNGISIGAINDAATIQTVFRLRKPSEYVPNDTSTSSCAVLDVGSPCFVTTDQNCAYVACDSKIVVLQFN